MEKKENVKYFCEIYELIDLYSYKRDMPADNDTVNFFEKLKRYCDLLNLDFETLKKEFNLTDYNDFY